MGMDDILELGEPLIEIFQEYWVVVVIVVALISLFILMT